MKEMNERVLELVNPRFLEGVNILRETGERLVEQGMFPESIEQGASTASGFFNDYLMRPSEAAAFLSVHINTVRRLSNKGVIPCLRVGTRHDRRFSRAALIKHLLSSGNGTQPSDQG